MTGRTRASDQPLYIKAGGAEHVEPSSLLYFQVFAIMGFTALLVTSLAAATTAVPLLNPIQAINAAGPAAGQVITKCNAPGQIALAYDDGPYQYTQRLADILSQGGAKGTFFVTGTLYGMRRK